MMQRILTAGERDNLVPEGADVPDTLNVHGIEITGDQYATLVNTIQPHLDIRVQRLSRGRIAIQTEMGNPPRWFVVDTNGEVTIPGLDQFMAARKED